MIWLLEERVSISEDELWAAYRSTEFRAATHLGPVSVRVGERGPSLERLLADTGETQWLFITAWNPASVELGEVENQERNCRLRVSLDELAAQVFAGLGQPAEPEWTPEESFLALGLTRAQAIFLGRQYGQNAVVWGEGEKPAELLDCRVT
jgi:hypothetical protein